MNWADFLDDTVLERSMLERALPIAATTSSGDVRIRISQGNVGATITVSAFDTMGPTPGACIELLGIRPLLFSAAWKVLDGFVEAVMPPSIPPDQRRGYRIETKVKTLKNGVSQDLLPQQVWEALSGVYRATVELRHSLTHRRVSTDASGALIGVDQTGKPLAPLSVAEQEAFVRAVLRLGEAASQSPDVDDRTRGDLSAWLARLPSLHKVPVDGAGVPDTIIEVTVVVDRDEKAGGYALNVSKVREDPNILARRYADLVVEFSDQPGRTAKGRLESAPSGDFLLDPDNLPPWLE